MALLSQLLHRIADPTLSNNERARLRCQLAKEYEEAGNYDAALNVMSELWSGIGERPVLETLKEETAAEVLLRVGALTGWIGSVKQVGGTQETAKNLISESLRKFETLSNPRKKRAEAQVELAICYWREGSYDEARVLLNEALAHLTQKDGDLRAVALLRIAIVEKVTNRLSDAFRFLSEAIPLFEASDNQTLKGRFHNEFGAVLMLLGNVENRLDYIDRALIEYTAASYHFSQAGHRRYQACIENNLGFLFGSINKHNDAHDHLDRAQALLTSLKDSVHLAQVDETRARVYLSEGRSADAEKLAGRRRRCLSGVGSSLCWRRR